MLNRNTIVCCLLALVFTVGTLQKTNAQTPLEIQQVELRDTLLKAVITNFITVESQKDSSFSKLGYVTLSSQKATSNAVLQSYHINKNWVNFDELENDNHFPLYYSYIAGKLILLYFDDVKQTLNYKFTRESKKKFQKAVAPFLFKAEKVVMVDKDNKPLKPGSYRPGEKVQLHGGIDFIRFETGETKVQQGTY